MPDPTIRAWLELLYFGSNLLLVVVAAFGLRQITLAKRLLAAAQEQLIVATEAVHIARNDIRVRSEREAVALAAERCEKFSTRIQHHFDLARNIQGAGVTLRRWRLKTANFDWCSFDDESAARTWAGETGTNKAATVPMVEILNDIEAFAIYFATGAAAEKVAFPVLGALFCYWVDIFAPHIAFARTNKDETLLVSDAYPNTIALYAVWAARHQRQRQSLGETTIDFHIEQVRAPGLRPIGTKPS